MAKRTTPVAVVSDPFSDESLLALDASYGRAPDMPVSVAKTEIGSLARLAGANKAKFVKLGLGPSVDLLPTAAARLSVLEAAWQKARKGVKITAAERKLLTEAEALDSKLLAGGRWGCRKDPEALEELDRIAEGSGLVDTVQDLKDEVVFWAAHSDERAVTNVTDKDLARATELAKALGPAAEKEANDVAAAQALELRDRCFWQADGIAREVREGGRYGFAAEPKIAHKFVSRYRVSAVRRARTRAAKNKGKTPVATLPTPVSTPATPALKKAAD